MKIQEILTENYNMYTVYKAYGPEDDRVYYGYAQGTEEDIARNFTAGVNRTDPDRAEKRMVDINGGDPADIKFEVVDVFADELDAWTMRNELRISDSQSLTGPTMFPGNILARAQKERPEQLEKWKAAMGMKEAKTAREAAQLGRWDQATVKALTTKFPRAEVVRDFDKLAPDAFASKYGLQ
jgi:hypothetical protein